MAKRAPVSVMSNWSNQIITHVHKSKNLRVAIYHGAVKLKMATEEMKNHDVVITSYGTLSSDVGNPKGLFSLSWHRVILDEGHNIRNARAQCALAACDLKADSRWVLSGTPIVNSIKDLHSIVKFLKLTGGIEEPQVFNTVITRPLAQGSHDGQALLQSLMQGICLRRKKDMAFVDLRLPPKTEYVHRITFRPEEKKKYEALLSEAKGVLEKVQARSKNGATVSSVLERLLRLRQMQVPHSLLFYHI